MKTLSSMAFASLMTAFLMTTVPQDKPAKKGEALHLGNFSVSLTVKDIEASKAFYEKLDFKPVAGNVKQRWLILQNGTTTVGLFQGVFERNTMTFNPGWNHKMETPESFQDLRELQRTLKERGIKLQTEADPKGEGPASFSTADPDGNPILFDQHVPKPKK